MESAIFMVSSGCVGFLLCSFSPYLFPQVDLVISKTCQTQQTYTEQTKCPHHLFWAMLVKDIHFLCFLSFHLTPCRKYNERHYICGKVEQLFHCWLARQNFYISPLFPFFSRFQYISDSLLNEGSLPLSLQALAEEMDSHNERLGWLNKHAPQILASPSVSPQSRDQHVGKLRAINLNWSKVRIASYNTNFLLVYPHHPLVSPLPSLLYLILGHSHMTINLCYRYTWRPHCSRVFEPLKQRSLKTLLAQF